MWYIISHCKYSGQFKIATKTLKGEIMYSFYSAFIISVVVGLIVLFLMRRVGNWKEKLSASGAALVIVLVVLFIIFSAKTETTLAKKWNVVGTEKLHSLKSKDAVNGDFFLGTGSIDGVKKYAFYRENEDGSYSYDDMNAKGVSVYEEDRADAVIVRYKEADDVPNDAGWWTRLSASMYEGVNKAFTIRVPKGTVDDKYFVSP